MLNDLPLEMFEMVLMRAFLMVYASDFVIDDEPVIPWCMSGKSRSTEHRAFTMLSSVCSYWRLTLTGWPQSRTSQWVRHKLKKLVERE